MKNTKKAKSAATVSMTATQESTSIDNTGMTNFRFVFFP